MGLVVRCSPPPPLPPQGGQQPPPTGTKSEPFVAPNGQRRLSHNSFAALEVEEVDDHGADDEHAEDKSKKDAYEEAKQDEPEDNLPFELVCRRPVETRSQRRIRRNKAKLEEAKEAKEKESRTQRRNRRRREDDAAATGATSATCLVADGSSTCEWPDSLSTRAGVPSPPGPVLGTTPPPRSQAEKLKLIRATCRVAAKLNHTEQLRHDILAVSRAALRDMGLDPGAIDEWCVLPDILASIAGSNS